MQEPVSGYNVVCYGEVLWDILLTGPLPGGAPMNVAFHLKKLGMNPTLITRVGYDNYGKDLVDMLSNDGVAVKYEVDTVYPTGLVYANVGDNHEMAYDIVYPSAWDFIEGKPEYADIVSEAEYFVFGSLTSRSDVSRETLYRLLKVAKTKVFDINLRTPHFEPGKLEFLLHQTDLLKMNRSELELVTDWFNQKGSTLDRIQFMQDHFSINQIIVTNGEEGAIVNDHGKIYEHPGYAVSVQDTIGSGDSFLAGFLSRLLKGEDTQKALDFATGLGAFVATQAGGTPDYSENEIWKLIEKGNSRED